MLHICKDGRIVSIDGESKKYPKMTDSHLLNTIKYIKRRAEGGIFISSATDWEDPFGDFIYGEEAENELDLWAFEKEARKRGLL